MYSFRNFIDSVMLAAHFLAFPSSGGRCPERADEGPAEGSIYRTAITDIFIRFADSPHQSLRDSFSPKGRSLYTLYHYTSGISTVIFIVFYLSLWYSVANKIYGAPLPEKHGGAGKEKEDGR